MLAAKVQELRWQELEILEMQEEVAVSAAKLMEKRREEIVSKMKIEA